MYSRYFYETLSVTSYDESVAIQSDGDPEVTSVMFKGVIIIFVIAETIDCSRYTVTSSNQLLFYFRYKYNQRDILIVKMLL